MAKNSTHFPSGEICIGPFTWRLSSSLGASAADVLFEEAFRIRPVRDLRTVREPDRCRLRAGTRSESRRRLADEIENPDVA